MSYTKFSSAACGMTIVAHGEMQVFSGNHIKQCLDAVCTGSESLHVFCKGLTDDPTFTRGGTAQFLASPECRALVSQIPDRVYESSATIPVGIDRSCIEFLSQDDLFFLDCSTCTVSECWTIRHSTTTGIVFTMIELYTIDDTDDDTVEQFTLVTTTMDPESSRKNPTQTFYSAGDADLSVVNLGRRSDMKMYCYHCYENVRTKICPCRKRRYCSSKCQKADWNEGDHKYDDDHHKSYNSDKVD